ncbi:MAG: oxidoreductase [Chromatiales bacterium]|nr:MAG: oxidoreductase [Chromatiales bacterium]
MGQTINAIVATETADGVRGELQQLDTTELPENDVLVDVAYSTVNYKDALAVSGKGKICRSLPMVCGIDLAGTVTESSAPAFAPGDQVLVNGWGLSEKHWGGYAQQQRLQPDWLVRVPGSLSLEQCMAIGTAGYTAMLCVHAIQDHGIGADAGPVVVTGATGGVGSIAVMLLSRLGYEVSAVSGKADAADFLTQLGAAEVLPRDELDRKARPLESERWAAAVDSVGSQTLATLLAQTAYGGCVAACGLAGGIDLPGTVMPFILRGVTLAGIDSVMAPADKRQRAWDALAELIDKDKLREVYTVEPLARVPELAGELLAGRVKGRIVIDVNA